MAGECGRTQTHNSCCRLGTASCIFTNTHTHESAAVCLSQSLRPTAAGWGGVGFLIVLRESDRHEERWPRPPLHTSAHTFACAPPPPPGPSSTARRLCGSVRDSLLQRLGRALRYTYGRKITHSGGSGGLYKLPASVHV